ncbi:aminoglycoside phosphotransferase family protein [Streptomyces sp. 891-h]|uniref:aminoglycoside phosphotransferase family protein n=1 Tax=Streptomyces sp. 891-h TaxID=2720714 RepID=UPI001FA9BE07|nr:aminoglycoside phosphotransferase family protein [Streptomyces sp. 891-h]UNZ16022.1 aminoglycoside phosphotransferase family protein [Streptomyces sp. 891-h]
MTSTSTGHTEPGTHSGPYPVDDGLVRRLVGGQFPQWADAAIERRRSGGTVNAVYRLGDDKAVRLPLTRGGAEDVLTEREWLPRLAPLLPTRIPELLGTGEPADGYPWPWAVYRWETGRHPEEGALSEPVPLAEDLAGFVAAMRNIALPGAPQAHRGGPLATLDAETRTAIARLRELPEEGVDCDAATAVWEDALRAPGWTGPPVWLHADLMPGNLLLDGGRLAAVIDFGCMGVGDPACDLFPAWNLLPAGAREVFRAALGVDDATWSRGRARTLSQALIALPHYRRTNPAMAHNARHVIRAVLDEG